MTHITYAPVDRQFRCLARDLPGGAPFNGADPIPGITFGFALESRYPLTNGEPATYFGTVEGAVEDNPAINLRVITQAEYYVAYDAEMAARGVTSAEVNAERDRRIRSGFTFNGKSYDYDDAAQKRITGAATLAGFAAGAGAPEGYMLWHGGADPFAWIAQDNSLTSMDAQMCFAFGQAAAAHESAHVFAARALKDAEGGIPADYADDAYWP